MVWLIIGFVILAWFMIGPSKPEPRETKSPRMRREMEQYRRQELREVEEDCDWTDCLE